MPTVLIIEGFRFFFYSNEIERMHIHVEFQGMEAKIWLDTFEVANHIRFKDYQLRTVVRIVRKNEKKLKKAWIEHFG